MNAAKIAYWISTVLICLLYLSSTGFYLSDYAGTQAAFTAFGFPAYIVPLLIVVKPLAVLAILVRRPAWLSDLAYAGMLYHLPLAMSAHLNVGDGGWPAALIALALMLVSFFTQNAARAAPSPLASAILGR